MRAHLTKYSAGMTFATTFRALAKLSHAASLHLSPIMAAAAYAMNDYNTTASENSTETAPGADDAKYRTRPPKGRVSIQQKADDPIASYLEIVQRPTTAPKITRIQATVGRFGCNTGGVFKQVVCAASQAERQVARQRRKGLILVESDTPLAAPTHLRYTLTFGGSALPWWSYQRLIQLKWLYAHQNRF